jgi:hypothetical protein
LLIDRYASQSQGDDRESQRAHRLQPARQSGSSQPRNS